MLAGFLAILGVVCRLRRPSSDGPQIAFFHPYCNDGGGGERVLWVGIAALLAQKPGLKVAIYTGDDVTPEQILQNVENRFGLRLPSESIDFVYLRCVFPPFFLTFRSIFGWLWLAFGSRILHFLLTSSLKFSLLFCSRFCVRTSATAAGSRPAVIRG